MHDLTTQEKNFQEHLISEMRNLIREELAPKKPESEPTPVTPTPEPTPVPAVEPTPEPKPKPEWFKSKKSK